MSYNFDYRKEEYYERVEDIIFKVIRNGNMIPYDQISVVESSEIERELFNDENFIRLIYDGASDRELKSYVKEYVKIFKDERKNNNRVEDIIFNVIRYNNLIPYKQLNTIDSVEIERKLFNDEEFLYLIDNEASDRQIKSYVKEYVKWYKENKDW